jgi:ribosome-associated toxin RatA of RatAB toxin-antitoxin module
MVAILMLRLARSALSCRSMNPPCGPATGGRRHACFDLPVTFLFLTLLAGTAAAETPAPAGVFQDPVLEAGWQAVSERNGLRLYNRAVPGAAVPAALARVRIEVPPARLFAVITDYDRFAEFVPYVVHSRVVRRDAGRRLVSQHLRFPGPVADRHYVIESRDTVTPLPPERWRVEWRLAPEKDFPALEEKGITPAAFTGYWELTPAAGGAATDAIYALHFDPGGALPAWLVTFAMNRYLPRVIDAVRARAASLN